MEKQIKTFVDVEEHALYLFVESIFFMKTLAIYTFVPSTDFKWDGNSLNGDAIGNSEIWVIKVAEEFVKRGYDVTVFGNPVENGVVVNNVRYVNVNDFASECDSAKFDFIIANRCVYEIADSVPDGSVVLKCQDPMVVGAKVMDDLKLSKVYKICVQTDFHKKMLKDKYGLSDDVFCDSAFGFDMPEYNQNAMRENQMIMHVYPGRQVRWFIEEVLPLVRDAVPDFKLKLYGSGIDRSLGVYSAEGVEIMENSDMESVLLERIKSKVWAYPNHGYNSNFDIDDEVFPNEAMENAAAGCACVFGKWGSYVSAFDGYIGFVGDDLYSDMSTPMDYENIPKFANELADGIIRCIKDENWFKTLSDSARCIASGFSWEMEVDTLENQLKEANKTVQVYVLAHKQFPYMISEPTRKVLQVGSKNKGSVIFSDLTDSSFADNRAVENGFMCELTGIYAIYKNLAGDTDIVGNEHYRRHFNISDVEIKKSLSTHDIILPEPLKLGETVYDQYKRCHIKSDLDKCRTIIHDLFPQYDRAFDDYIVNGDELYYANSLITTSKQYVRINGFIFSVLDELINRTGFRTYNAWHKHAKLADKTMLPGDHKNDGLSIQGYQARSCAFLYERLLTMFVKAEGLSVKHVDFVRLDEEWEKNNTKVMLVSIGRLENRYIREFVEFYRYIGVTNICLCDNNRDGEEDFHDVIGDYIDNGYVILKDYRNVPSPCQVEAYDACYKEYKDKYDWFMFFDIDEFMFLNKTRDVRTYLSNPMFKDFEMIHVNWLNFGDCGNVKSGEGGVMRRFPKPLDLNLATTYKFPDNYHVKSIVRGGLDNVVWTKQPHTPFVGGAVCNGSGVKVESKSIFQPYDYRYAGLRHYTTKSAEEYSNKVNRGFCDDNPSSKKDMIGLYFKRNEVTDEKVALFKDVCGVDMSDLLPRVYDGVKRDDVKIYTLCYDKKNFNFLEDSVVTPLQVGAANGNDVCAIKDNTGENISDRNYFFVEGTGTYWIWKNVKNAKYKGQMQYRRPLEGVDESMDFDGIFEKYDVITCEPFHHPDHKKPTKDEPRVIDADTVEQGYAFSNCLDDLVIMEMIVKTYYPEYTESWDKYIKHGEDLYYSNGFVMKTGDYNRYADFLFGCLEKYLSVTGIHDKDSLMDHVRYNLEVGKYPRYQNPKQVPDEAVKWQSLIGGFLSERLWTLWLRHNFKEDRIMKVPYVKMEPDKMYT